MIEEAIVALLMGSDAITAQIVDRIYPILLPENGDSTLAAVTYQVVSDIPEYTLADGVSSQKARVQITAWAPDPKTAKVLANIIRGVLELYSGTAGSIAIANTWIAGQMSGFEQDLRQYRVQTDYMFIYAATS